MHVFIEKNGPAPMVAVATSAAHPAPAATPHNASPMRVELVAESRHGELVQRRLTIKPGLPAFVRLLADLRYCGYRGIVLRKVGR